MYCCMVKIYYSHLKMQNILIMPPLYKPMFQHYYRKFWGSKGKTKELKTDQIKYLVSKLPQKPHLNFIRIMEREFADQEFIKAS